MSVGSVACALLGTADLAVLDLRLVPELLRARDVETSAAPTSVVESLRAELPAPAMTKAAAVGVAPPSAPVQPALALAAPTPLPAPRPESSPPPPLAVAVAETSFVVQFETNEASLSAAAHETISHVAAAILGQGDLRAQIGGHADQRGPTEYNERLSLARARSVAGALAGAGVDRSRLDVRAFGASRPLVAGDTEDVLARNRRVEILIVGGKK
jgi:outer membrane protein OmpA-like peptidoglycan-associated protein